MIRHEQSSVVINTTALRWVIFLTLLNLFLWSWSHCGALAFAVQRSDHKLIRYKKEHSIDLQLIQLVDGKILNWETKGSTLVTDEYIRLSQAKHYDQGKNDKDGITEKFRAGYLWNSLPMGIKNWETEFKFRIKTKSTSHPSAADGPYSDGGIIFYYVRDPEQMTLDAFHGLSIIIQTYPWTWSKSMSNHSDSDSELAHKMQKKNYSSDDVYVYSLVRGEALKIDGDERLRFDGCFMHKAKNAESVTMLKVRYDNNLVTVWTNVEDEHKWELCLQFKVVLPPHYHLGFSSFASNSSLEIQETLDIISVSTWKIIQTKGVAIPDKTNSDSSILTQQNGKVRDIPKSLENFLGDDDDNDPLHQELQDSAFIERRVIKNPEEEAEKGPSKAFVVPLIILATFVIFCLFGCLMSYKDRYEP